MWSPPDNRDTQYWQGTFKADRFIGNGAGLTNLPAGTETDPNFVLLSASLSYLPVSLSASLGNFYLPVSLSAALAYPSYTYTNAISSSLTTHTSLVTNPHSATLWQTNASFSGALSASIANFSSTVSAAKIVITADQSTSGVAYVANVLFDTNATAPTASNYPIGSIYVRYTA